MTSCRLHQDIWLQPLIFISSFFILYYEFAVVSIVPSSTTVSLLTEKTKLQLLCLPRTPHSHANLYQELQATVSTITDDYDNVDYDDGTVFDGVGNNEISPLSLDN